MRHPIPVRVPYTMDATHRVGAHGIVQIAESVDDCPVDWVRSRWATCMALSQFDLDLPFHVHGSAEEAPITA